MSLHRQVGYDLMGITAVGATIPTGFAERGGAARIFVRPLSVEWGLWSRI
jgi:hypothetical protein